MPAGPNESGASFIFPAQWLRRIKFDSFSAQSRTSVEMLTGRYVRGDRRKKGKSYLWKERQAALLSYPNDCSTRKGFLAAQAQQKQSRVVLDFAACERTGSSRLP
jgi:hypothetical protein